MSHFLECIKVPQRTQKPRKVGLTLMRDQGLSPDQAFEFMKTCDEFVDYAKIKQFELWYMKPWITEEKVRIYTSHAVIPFPGGTVIEAAWVRNKVDEALQELRNIGFTCIELSDNIIDFTDDEKKLLVEKAINLGFEVLMEYGKKYQEGTIELKEAKEGIKGLQDAGVKHFILERALLDNTIGFNGEGSHGNLIRELVDIVGLEPLIFEAESFGQINWLLHTFGGDVNLGPNLSPEFIISKLEPARYGLGRDEGYSFFDTLRKTN